MKKALLAVTFLLIGAIPQMAQTKFVSLKKDICYQWQTQVDPSLPRIKINEGALTDSEIIEAIGCLLNLKGNKHIARFTGTTRLNTKSSQGYSRLSNPATIEIASLYYISYLFYDNWEHASSVRLYNEDSEEINSEENVDEAYRYYENWFDEIKKLGLKEARRQKIDPLANCRIAWS